jgi:hypothetical protein
MEFEMLPNSLPPDEDLDALLEGEEAAAPQPPPHGDREVPVRVHRTHGHGHVHGQERRAPRQFAGIAWPDQWWARLGLGCLFFIVFLTFCCLCSLCCNAWVNVDTTIRYAPTPTEHNWVLPDSDFFFPA